MALLRAIVRRGLAAFGLASARHLAALEARAQTQHDAVERAREEARSWKAQADALRERAQQADALAARLEKAERRAERADRYLAELREARERIQRAEKAIALSREHLMATETKLELVEAAIALLDRRTRV